MPASFASPVIIGNRHDPQRIRTFGNERRHALMPLPLPIDALGNLGICCRGELHYEYQVDGFRRLGVFSNFDRHVSWKQLARDPLHPDPKADQ